MKKDGTKKIGDIYQMIFDSLEDLNEWKDEQEYDMVVISVQVDRATDGDIYSLFYGIVG